MLYIKNIFLGIALYSSQSWASVDINVAVYPFRPFVETKDNGTWQGVTFDIVDALNKVQKDYHYRTVVTSPYRLYPELYAGKFDISLFEDVRWSWELNKVIISPPILDYADCYVALNKAGRDQSFFSNLKEMSMIGIRGYHFPGYKGDITLKDDRRVLDALLLERGDFGLIGYYNLLKAISERPELKYKLLVADQQAERYILRAIFSAKSKLTLPEFQKHMKLIELDGSLDAIWNKYHIRHEVDESSALSCSFKYES